MIERYTLPEMGRVWSDQHKYELWCRVETLVLEAHAAAGRVPADVVEPVRKASPPTPERVAELVGGDGTVDAAVDFIGGAALEVSPRLVRDPARHGSVVDTEVLNQGGRYVFVRPDTSQLNWLGELVDTGRLRVDLQQTFPLEQAVKAHELLEEGHVRGKLVLTVG